MWGQSITSSSLYTSSGNDKQRSTEQEEQRYTRPLSLFKKPRTKSNWSFNLVDPAISPDDDTVPRSPHFQHPSKVRKSATLSLRVVGWNSFLGDVFEFVQESKGGRLSLEGSHFKILIHPKPFQWSMQIQIGKTSQIGQIVLWYQQE